MIKLDSRHTKFFRADATYEQEAVARVAQVEKLIGAHCTLQDDQSVKYLRFSKESRQALLICSRMPMRTARQTSVEFGISIILQHAMCYMMCLSLTLEVDRNENSY